MHICKVVQLNWLSLIQEPYVTVPELRGIFRTIKKF